ncbi:MULTISPECIES: hypothetical protein [Ectopseudomonas]|uniref:Uncharacterized protein n=2 Tax=Ectopseudomonas TaxID=3236654 RepID=A0A1G6PRH3_9GAMM|nr:MULTISPECIES: hypothetical protein [Pseudomonas]ALN21943.1 hypothetical protein DW68_025020 [Pseudomonas mendocina S5.2]KER98004.1 hypothetical protein HN51_24675 [Pseudomonas mendocina]MBP3061900.1 hypothetical protein [Pseudomonas chengduensis]NNB75192.1 hypothetical protein [Pseudomonas chengduensis]OEO24568.1 hypothetical protein AX279_18050 [Pseudomonas sp. J237]
MSIAYDALTVTEREAVDEAVDAASAKLSDWGIDVPFQKLKDAVEEALAGVVLQFVRAQKGVQAPAAAQLPDADPVTAANETADLSYRHLGLFTSFLANTPAGENAWREIAAKTDGTGKVLSIHAEDTIRQLRAAGYAVAEAGEVVTGDEDAILAELGLLDGQDQQATVVAAVPKKQLALLKTDNGLARVYYRGPAGLYCFLQQDRHQGPNQFGLFRCTDSGEPDYPVDIEKFEVDLVPAGDCSTATAFRAWHAARA